MRAAAIATMLVTGAAAALLLVGAIGCRRGGPDWRVVELYAGSTGYGVLKGADKVRVFAVAPERAVPRAGDVHAGPYVAVAAPADLSPESVAALTAVLTDPDTYDWRRAKSVGFAPRVGIWFVRGPERLEIALDLDSAQLAIYAEDMCVGAEDCDAAKDRLRELLRPYLGGGKTDGR